MAKKNDGAFYERHPFIALVTFPFSLIASKLASLIGEEIRLGRAEQEVMDMSGSEYEEYAADRLAALGYKGISVTKRSNDYGADIIAYDRRGNKICVQCKKYSGTVGVSAVQEVIAAKQYYNCDFAMVVTNSTFTPNAVSLAEAAGVELKEKFF